MTLPSLHPPISSFPIALLSVTLIFEVVWRVSGAAWASSAAKFMVCLSGVAVLAVFFTGYQASEYADQTFHIPDAAIALHHLFGKLLLFSSVALVVVWLVGSVAVRGRTVFQNIALVLLLACITLSAISGYLGGKLVFEYGAGVTAKPNPLGN